MQIGYIRVSTNDQNIELQEEALIRAKCDHIFVDKMSGTKAVRPGLKKCLKMLKRGDTLVVWKLDRLGRSAKNMIILLSELDERGIHFRSLTDSIDTSTRMGKLIFTIMSAFAEMERSLIVERTVAGLAAAREKGRVGGRKRVMTDDVVARAKRMFANGATLHQVANIIGVSHITIYKYIPAAEQHALRRLAETPQ
ncbi:recombinase family protein [Hafnia alvei]|uniref:recombinase family protein n=1 Tax=Hafnia alvei TaxID=569 RepID=UPI002DC029B0|nr:recombinase family protein [Hafnia alvei]MEB7892033.1 recombinase family protein [Hafnia alvei]